MLFLYIQRKSERPAIMRTFPIHLINERAGIRTPDNLIKSQVLYHLSYTPLFYCIPCKYLFYYREKCPEPESNQ